MKVALVAHGDNASEVKDLFYREGFELIEKECTNEKEYIELLKDVDGALIYIHPPTTRKVMEETKHLKVISRGGVGVDSVDLDAATELGICVCNTPGVNTTEVADHAMALLLSITRKITEQNELVKKGYWTDKAELIQPYRSELGRIAGKVVGIIGLGNIGKAFSTRIKGFGPSKIISYDPHIDRTTADLFGVDESNKMYPKWTILESALSDMRNIVKTKGARKINGIMVDMFTASVITQAYDKVNDANKKKMENANLQTLVKLAHKIMGMKEELNLNESKMGDLLIDIQMGATAKELAKDHDISLAAAKNFLSDYYGRKKSSKAPGLKKEGIDEGKMKDIVIDFEDGVSDAKIAKSHGVSIQVIKGLRKDWKSMGEENLKERVGFKKLRQIKSKWKKQIADFQRGKDLDYDAEVDLLAYAYDKGLVRSDDPDEVDDWLMKNVADKRAFNKLKEESKEDKLKEQREHAQQSPFKLKSQAYPRAIAINTDGFGNRHATVEDIITACDTFGMILDKELQVEQVQKELGKRGFISFKQSDLDDVFDERETQRVILALESAVEKQEPIDYTKDEVEDAYIMGEEIEFVKPDGLKTAGKVLKLSGNTYNVKDKFTGKSFTYKYIGETEVKTFKEVLNEGRFPKKLVKQAMGIVWDKRYAGGNMTGAVKAIEKLKKGLSDDPDVSNALRLANEGIDKWIPEGGDKEAYTKFFNKALKKFGVNSPDELEGEKKKEFFDYVDKNWKGDHEEKEANPSDHKIDGRRKNFREKMRKLGYIKGN